MPETPKQFLPNGLYDALLTVLKKWTFNLPMKRATSGRHVFEANVNRFALILQVHGTKPLDDLAQQASIRKRYTGGIDPVDDLRKRLHPSPAALKEQAQDPLQTHLGLSRRQQRHQEGPQRILQ